MKTLFSVAFVTAATLGMGAAIAQDTVALEEIVVTASKREQTLNDIPSAVSVTSAETIEKAHITDILDLHTAVPSLRTSQLQTSTQTNFIIRGFGNGANNPGIESSVGVFIDGVYRSRSASQIGDLVDVERIEVLRGPQSTLFGQNASVGVISVVTRKPSFTTTGSVEVGFGNYNAKMARAGISAPIGDRVAFSLSGNYNERDGYFKNLINGHDVNDRSRWDLRGQLLFNATDDLTFRLIADTSEIDELCCGVSNLQNGPTGAIITAIGGQIYTGSPFDRRAYLNKDPYNTVDNDGVSLQVDWTHGNWTLTSITADRNQKAKFDYDADFTSADILATNLNDSSIDTFTEELRLVFDNGGPVTGLLGGYYFNENVDYENTLAWGNSIRPYATGLIFAQTGSLTVLSSLETALGLPAGTLLQGGQGQVISTSQDSEVSTVFGQLDWKVTDRMTLTAGVAYAQVKKDVSIDQTDTDVFSSLNFVQIGFGGAFAALTGLPPTPANIAANLPQANLADQISVTACSATSPPPLCNSALALYPFQFLAPVVPFSDGRSDDSKMTYTARLSFDLNDSIMMYGGVSTGFKATSWNLSRDTRPVPPALGYDLTPFGRPNPYYARYGTRLAGPEESTVYEIGFKGKWQQLALNIAIFDEEITDFQSNTFLGTGFGLLNAGKQSVQGGEFDLLYVPSSHWEFSVAGTFLDPLYDTFEIGPAVQNLPGDAATTDLSGTKPAGISSFTGVVTATYRWSVGEWEAFVRANFNHESNVRVIENVPEGVASREVNTVNASAGVSRDDWDVLLWGHNLGNDDYLISAFPSVAQFGSYSGYPSQPRTYGVTVRKRF
ncbi:MAG: transporter, outer rane receptor family [Steroidobacteraceae bacterium]|nr:transporter, outer rane receptor family [Steroidobacteraceae bacterium]